MRFCPDCESEHMGLNPCGMTYAQRLRSIVTTTTWMPAKTRDRETFKRDEKGHLRAEKEFYDDEALTEMFDDGLTGAERAEKLMESTQGVGFATREDIEKYPELVAAHYLDNPANAIEEEVGVG